MSSAVLQAENKSRFGGGFLSRVLFGGEDEHGKAWTTAPITSVNIYRRAVFETSKPYPISPI